MAAWDFQKLNFKIVSEVRSELAGKLDIDILQKALYGGTGRGRSKKYDGKIRFDNLNGGYLSGKLRVARGKAA